MPTKLLLVDDDAVDRMAVRRALSKANIDVEVIEQEKGADAIDALSDNGYACVLLDYLLPDMTGLDVLRKVRETGIMTPIIILTGQGDERLAVELMKAGACDYLPKNLVTPERILQTLRNALRIHDMEVAARQAESERQRLLEGERAARAEAEAAHHRLLFLAEASTAFADSLETDLALDTIAGLAVPTLGDWVLVELQDSRGFVRGCARRWDGQLRRFAKPRKERALPMPRTSSRLEGDEFEKTITFSEEHRDLLEGRELKEGIQVPLIARGRAIGAITLGILPESRPYSDQDLAFAREVARRAAIAVDNARLYEEAREASARLRQQLDLTRAITNSLAEGVCALDLHGRITFLNPAAEASLQWHSDDVIGRDLHETVHACDTPECCSMRDSLGLGRLVRSDAVFRRRDGSTFSVIYAMAPILSEGRIVGTVLTFHDVTEQRRAESELEESRRQMAMSEKLSALGTLISGVAHELRTPLTYVANNVFLIRHRLDKAAAAHPELGEPLQDVTRFSEEAMDGIDRINALLRDLRPFVNPEPGIRMPAKLDEVVATAVDLFRATQRGRSEVEADLRETGAIEMDKGQIQRVVINLLLNAMEAMESGGRIHVTTRAVEGGAEIEVEDEGPGLPPEVRARIFDPFFTTKAEGTGLGLSITRSVVEAHGGTIRYRTEEKVGTTFIVFLPTNPRQVKVTSPNAKKTA